MKTIIIQADIQNFFFLGIGGIGISALARYFHHRGYAVSGYDRTPSGLTKELESEGISITYEDDPSFLQNSSISFNPKHTLVVRTPAVPADCALSTYLREQGYSIRKRAEVLGLVTYGLKALCVAGTHGKTTTSTMLAHLLYQSEIGTNAFLGGISMNYGTNILLLKDSSYVVVEADEYDRSFHQLRPYMSVVTAVDADHLDIYGTPEAYREAFADYTALITGALVMKQGIALEPKLQKGVKCYTYGVLSNEPKPKDLNFYADHIRVEKGQIYFDFHIDIPANTTTTIPDVKLGVPVYVNIENAVAAMSVAWLNGLSENELRNGIASFRGVSRRFNIHVNTPKVAYVDDYAHHPEEIRKSLSSINQLYGGRHLKVIFQPHLYTRTRDVYKEFADALSLVKDIALVDIYPARELPIEGVTSALIAENLQPDVKCELCHKEDVLDIVRRRDFDVLVTLGAGDLDNYADDITAILNA